MIKFKNINGDVFLAVGSIKRKSALNGEKSLTGTLFEGDDVLNKIDKGWSLEFDNEPYVVTYFERNDNDNTVEFDAIHKFFWDMNKSVLYSSASGSHTAKWYLDQIFNGTGYTYALNFDPSAFEKDNWGMKNKLSLFNDAISGMGGEFEINGTLVSIFKNIGSDLSTIVRHGFNLSDMSLENDNTDFVTYGEGFGAYVDQENQTGERLHVTYTSPLAKTFGKLHAEPIDDQRYTIKDNLLQAIKDKVDGSFAISIKLSLYDLTAAGYPYKMANVGDWLLAIDENLDFKQKIRIISVDDEFATDGTRLSYTVTCGDIGVVQKYQQANASLGQKVASAYQNAQDAKESSIQAVIAANGKNTNYYVNGIDNLPATANEGDIAFVQTGDGEAMYIYTKMPDGSFKWVKRIDPDTGEQIAAGVDLAIETAQSQAAAMDEVRASEAAVFQSEANAALGSAAAERAVFSSNAASMARSASAHADTVASSAAAYGKAQAASALSEANDALTAAKSDLTTSIEQEIADRNEAVQTVNSQAQDYASQAKSDAITAAETADGVVRKYFKETTDSLSSTISQNKQDADGKISTAQTTATQALNGLSTKVSQTDYDKKTSDLSTKVNTVTQTATETKDELASVSKTVDSQSAKINTISNTVDGTTQTISDIQTEQGKQSGSIATLQSRADGFEATVTKVDNLSVGGRNYVQNSSGLNGSSTVRPTLIGVSSGANTTVAYLSDGILMTNEATNTTKEWYYQVASAWANFSATPLTPGKQVTFSADVMGTVPQAVLRYGFNGGTGGKEGSKNFDINNTSWTRISITVASTSTNIGIYFRIQGGMNNQYATGWSGGETLKFRYVKIEDGNTPTAWSPAPEDVDSATAKAQLTADQAALSIKNYQSTADGKFNSQAAAITANSKAIDTKVSQTNFDTVTGDLTTKYGNVKTTADAVTAEVTKYETANDKKVSANTASINTLNNQITSKVSQTDFDKTTGDLSGKYSIQQQTINGISQTVTDLQAKANAQGQVNQLMNTEFNPDLEGWTLYADTGSRPPYKSFMAYGSNVIGFDTTNAAASTFARLSQTILLPSTRLSTDVMSLTWRVNTRRMDNYCHIWLAWQDANGNSVADRTMGNWNDSTLNKYNVLKWENISIPIDAKQVMISFESREGTNAYIFQPMVSFTSTIGDYVPGNYNNNTRVAALEVSLNGITQTVQDPKNGLSATNKLASDSNTLAINAQNDATNAVTTANGVQTIVTNVQKDVKDLQSTTVQTAGQVSTEIEDRKSGDKSVVTQMTSLIDQRLIDTKKGYESAISQSADAIIASVSQPNQFLNTEFNPDTEGWTLTADAGARAPYKSFATYGSNGIGFDTTNAPANTFIRLSQTVQLPSTRLATDVMSLSWRVNIRRMDNYCHIWLNWLDANGNKAADRTMGNWNDTKLNQYNVLKWENISIPIDAKQVLVSFETREGTSAYLFQPMLVFSATIGTYTAGSYSGMNTSTVLELFKDNWAIGIQDNVGLITSGIIGDKKNIALISDNVVIKSPSTQITGTTWITSAMIKDGAIGNAQIGNAAISSAQIINVDVSKISGNIANFITANVDTLNARVLYGDTGHLGTTDTGRIINKQDNHLQLAAKGFYDSTNDRAQLELLGNSDNSISDDMKGSLNYYGNPTDKGHGLGIRMKYNQILAIDEDGGSKNLYLSPYAGGQVRIVSRDLNSYYDIAAANFRVSSQRKFKSDIKPLDDGALDIVNKTNIKSYTKNGVSEIGVIADEAPSEVLSDDGKFINIYDYTSILYKAVQELSQQVEELKDERTSNQ